MDDATRVQIEGPTGAAEEWVNAIVRYGTFAAAWPITDLDMRENLVATWVANNRNHPELIDEDPEEIVSDLASLTPKRRLLWQAFDASSIPCYRQAWSHVDLDRWCWGKPHPAGLDIEGVVLIDATGLGGEEPVNLDPGGRDALVFLLRYVEGSWLVIDVDSIRAHVESG